MANPSVARAAVLLALVSLGLGPCRAWGQDNKQRAPVVPPRKGERQVIHLFNGKDLAGWEGHARYWSVQDGAVVGKNTEPVPVMFPSGYGFYDLYGRNLIHDNGAKARQVGKQHGWNHIEILAQGNRVRFVLNGVLISDWREPQPERIREAPIGLQLHANKEPQEVRFKGLVLETFPEDRLTTLRSAQPGTGRGP